MPSVACVSGCGVGVPHPIGGSALVNLVVVVLHLGGGPPGIGFWSIRIRVEMKKLGAKMMVFDGLALVLGCGFGADVYKD